LLNRNSFFPAVTWVIISTILFILPAASFPKANWLDDIWFDKWVHAGLFFILVILWCRALSFKVQYRRLVSVFILTGTLALIYGVGMELIQHYCIANRSFDGGDVVADAVGCAAGVVYSRRYIKK
jgi:hypothetical protein